MYDSDTDGFLEEILEGTVNQDPEHVFISKENTELLNEKINEVLSDLEKSVLVLYLEGKCYQEIAKVLNKPPKSIDNALQRVKKKMEKFENMQ